jgi:tRNA (cmo5U34)-methyltransferase
MLDRAKERVSAATKGKVECRQSDIRDLDPGAARFDIILAAAVLHHLRSDEEWKNVFASFYWWLRPGGSIWIFDMVESTLREIEAMMRRRYGEYLTGLKDAAYRDHVFAYIAKEDTPRPLLFQLDLLKAVGFQDVEVLHKNGPFAAFGAVK